MKKICLSIALLASFVYGENLKSLLNYALVHNDLSVSKDIDTKKPLLESQSIKKEYYPTIDIGGTYQITDPRNMGRPGDIYGGFAKVSVNLFDGNKKKYMLNAKNYEFESLKFQSASFKKQLQFNIVSLYFQIKILKADLEALEGAKEYLNAEYKRIKDLYNVGNVTEDEVKKIEASLLNTVYQIDEVKYKLEDAKKTLALNVGKDINGIDDSTILPPKNITPDTLDNIKALKASQKSIEYNSKSLNSAYMPQINIEDTYGVYGYKRTDIMHPKGEDHQNQLSLTLGMRLFDNGAVKKQKEAVLIQKLSLQKQVSFYEKEQKKNIQMALLNIKTVKAQIESAKKSLEAANEAFRLITNRYHNGAVTVVDYLDALSDKTNAMAQYKTALYNLQIAYGTYYLYSNKEIKEFVK